MEVYLYINTDEEFNSEQKLNFSRPGRPPKRFLPPQFSSTPPLLSSSQVSTPTNTSKQVKPAYEGELYLELAREKKGPYKMVSISLCLVLKLALIIKH